jgi:hypothetical protein
METPSVYPVEVIEPDSPDYEKALEIIARS